MQNAAQTESWRDSFVIGLESAMNEQANQVRRKDLLLPSSLPSTGWTSGNEQVALELGSCPSDIPEDSYSMQVSSQYRDKELLTKKEIIIYPYNKEVRNHAC